MSWRNGLFPVLFAALVLVSGCVAPIAPGLASPKAPGAASSVAPQQCLLIDATGTAKAGECGTDVRYDATERTSACKSVYPFDAVQAYTDTIATADATVWTFGVNFDLLNPDDGAPVGCLRLLRRDDTNHTFVEIDHGGILVESCSTATTLPPITAGIASFNGTGASIQCGMNLAGWFADVEVQGYIEDSLGELSPGDLVTMLLSSIPPSLVQEYKHLAFVSRALWTSAVDCNGPCLLPIMIVAPDTGASTPPVEPALLTHGLAVASLGGGAELRFPLPDDVCTDPPTWAIDETPALIWRILPSENPIGSGETEYRYRLESGGSEVACFDSSWPGSASFWMGPSLLTIGLDPETGDAFQGELDGVLIDPPNSKPPARTPGG